MLAKQSIPINFAQGLDQKTDEKQIQIGKFLSLENSIFTNGGLLQKRNGFPLLINQATPYPESVATLGGGLITIGSSVEYYSEELDQLVNRGAFQPVDLSVLPAIRNSAGQSTADLAIAPNGLACVVATDSQAGGIYQIIDSVTGNVIVSITALSGDTSPQPKVFLLGTYFIITYTASSATVLKYIAIPYATPASPGSPATLAAATTSPGSYDGFVYNGTLYFAYNSTDNSGHSFRLNTLSSSLVVGTSVEKDLFANHTTTNTSVTVDPSNGDIWVTLGLFTYDGDTSSNSVYTNAFNSSLVNIVSNEIIYTSSLSGYITLSALTISTIAEAGLNSIFIGYNFLALANQVGLFVGYCSNASIVGDAQPLLSYIIPASRPFLNPANNAICLMVAYSSSYQPSYFMIDINGNVIAKLAYSNGGFPLNTVFNVLTNVNQSGEKIQIAYLYQDQISSVNKGTSAGGVEIGGIYAQAGVNIATITQGASNTVSSELAGSLQLSGGFLWMFDGQKPVEQNFHVYPDNITATVTEGSGGSIAAQQYYYQVTYEWTDAAGNNHRSAPSIPVTVTVSDANSSVIINIPWLGLTAKTAPNPARIVLYRWSVANPVYYQITSITDTNSANPLVINVQSNFGFYEFTDTLADASIIGNNIIYTNGGVIEDTGAPASSILSLFDDRLWLVDAEDPNLLWYSKQVIEATPVEMSDLLTFYVAPSTASQGSTGPITALAPMDDKLIIFKQSADAQAIYYINGTGPDNTGSNNQYSQPIFITSTVGCSNPVSIVFMPQGLMFQSNKGIWLLGRDLSTEYIGAPVEGFNGSIVTSAVNIPGTNQVRFTLNTGETLMYDYYYSQWGTFTGAPAISSCIYQGLHTLLDDAGNICQETPGAYIDNSGPVLMSFLTGWIQLQGISGYQRFYEMQLLGQYFTPHLLDVQYGYDFAALSEQVTIQPTNYNPVGSPVALEQWRIQPSQQKCQAFQMSLTEIYDSSLGIAAGAGFSLSAMTATLGLIKSNRPVKATNTTGTS